jgi:hypothetical protein
MVGTARCPKALGTTQRHEPVATTDFNGDNFVTSDDQCTGHKLDAGDSCTVKAAFRPLPFEGAKTGILRAKSDVADDGQADAVLTGVAVDS